MYFVYVLRFDQDSNLYIGFTANLKRRLAEHAQGKNVSTQKRGAPKLIYFEGYIHKMDALGRELFLKSGSGHRFLKKQLKNFLCTA